MNRLILLLAALLMAVGLVSAIYISFFPHLGNNGSVDSKFIQFVDSAPSIDEQWGKITTTGNWALGRSSFVGTTNAQPYTYKLKTTDPHVGCAVTPVFNKNTTVIGLVYGVIIFEKNPEGDDYWISEAGYTKVDNTGKILSKPISSAERYEFKTACGQYISKLPAYVMIYFWDF